MSKARKRPKPQRQTIRARAGTLSPGETLDGEAGEEIEPRRSVKTVTIEIPIAITDVEASGPVHLDVNLSRKDASVIEKIFVGLREEHQTLSNGHHVDRRVDVLRWLVDAVAEQLST